MNFSIVRYCCMIALNIVLNSSFGNQNIPQTNVITISGSGFQKDRSGILLKQWNKTFSAAITLAEPVWLNDSSFVISYESKQPEMAILTSRYGSYDVYITPGDRIKVTLILAKDKPQLQFKGTHSGNYNYSHEAGNAFRTNIPFNSIQNNIEHTERSKLIRHAYQVMDAFNIEFLQREKISAPFKKYVEAYKYWLVVNAFSASQAIVNGKVIPDDFFIPKHYIHDPYFLDSRTATLALSYYAMGHLARSNLDSLTSENLIASGKIIAEQFRGLTREYLLMDLIQLYGRNRNEDWVNAFDQIVQKAETLVKNSDYLASVHSWNAYFHKGNKPIPSDILSNTILTDTSNNAYTLAEIMDSVKGSILFIDFWATWCGPCKLEFEFYNEHQDIFESRGLKYRKLYLSFDEEKDVDKWKKDIEKYSLKGMNFMIRESKMSKIFKYLQISGIPHYIIIDKEGILRALDAPRPSNFQQLIQALKSFGA